MASIKLAEGALPATPGGASRVIFASSDGVYALDSGGGTTKFGAAGAGGGIAAGAGTQTATSGTVVFSNSNGITFGMAGSTQITASHNGLTTAAQSNHSHGNPTLNLTNLSGTTASNSAGFTLSLSAAPAQTVQPAVNLAAGTQTATSGTVVFANSNGMTFGLSGSTQVTASYTVPSTAGLLSAVNVSAGTTSNNLSALTFSNSNGITFGLNSSTVTASHNGITSQTAQTQSNVQGIIVSNTTYRTGDVSFSNANGITFGSSAGQAITASHNGLTTARASTDGIGLNTAQTNVTWTVNSSGLSLNAAGYAGTGTTLNGANISLSATLNSVGLQLSASVAAGGGGADGFNILAAGTQTAGTATTVNFANSNGLSWGMSGSSQITASYTVPSTAGLISAVNISAGTTSNNLSALTFSNSNGMSWGLNGSVLTAQQAVQLSGAGGAAARTNFSLTDANGVSWTVNGATVSASVRTDYASSNHAHNATFFATSNTTQSSSGLANISSIIFAGAGIASVGVTNGSVVISVPAGGGGGDGGNTLAAGTRTAGSNSVVLFSNSNGITFGLDTTNGSVMTASFGGQTISDWEPVPLGNNSSFSSYGQNTLYIQGIRPLQNVSFTAIEMFVSLSSATSSISHSVGQTFSYGLYSKGSGASTSRYELLSTSSFVMQASYSSNLSGGLTFGNANTSYTTSSAGTVFGSVLSGQKVMSLPFAGSVSAGGDYILVWANSTTSTGGTGALRASFLVKTNATNGSWGIIANTTVSVSAASITMNEPVLGIFSVTSGAWPANIVRSDISNNSVNQAYVYFEA